MKIERNLAEIDFLSYKKQLYYITILSLVLFGGIIFKNLYAILFPLLIVLFSISGNFFRAIEILFIWIFTNNFFIGQGYIDNEILIKYLAKPSFLIFVVFFLNINQLSIKILNKKYIFTWIVFLIIILLSSFIHSQSPFVIITISSFIFLYLLFQLKGLTTYQYKKLLNFFVAVAIVQTIVSFLQLTQIIPPPSKLMQDGSGGQFLWEAGLDDVASGTFGAGASYITSWYAALVSLVLIINWVISKKSKYLIVFLIVFLQFATVDSKIIMVVTFLMLCFLFYYVYKKRNEFNIDIIKYTWITLLIIINSIGFYYAWNSYYTYIGNNTGGDRTSLNQVFQDEAKESINLVSLNIADWGKFKGFKYIFEDFISNEPLNLIWGYGFQGYEFNGKMSYIESKDTPIMQLNNATNSRSALISLFAKTGVFGLFFILLSILFWYYSNLNSRKNSFDLMKIIILKTFLPFNILAAFLYPVDFDSIAFLSFAVIIAIYDRLSEKKGKYLKYID